MRITPLLAAGAALSLAAAALGAAPAHAKPAKAKPAVLATRLSSPLRVAVANARTVYVSQNDAGLITKAGAGKRPSTVFHYKGGEVGALSVAKGTVTFAITPTGSDSEERAVARRKRGPKIPTVRKVRASTVFRLSPKGKVTKLANVGKYEATRNPDASTAYGITDLDESCASQWPTDEAGPVTYTGMSDNSHPYATTRIGRTTYLADAGGNDIVAIGPGGKVRTVAVLPPSHVEITDEMAQAFQVPACTVGHTYLGEAVPTDIEAHHGKLYVTTLGGGLGEQLPLGTLYRVNRKSGAVTSVASGLPAPVGLAVAPRGAFYLSELFAGSIVRIPAAGGAPKAVAKQQMPAEVEIAGKRLYATVGALKPKKAKLISLRY